MGKLEGQVVGQGGPHTSLVPLPDLPPAPPLRATHSKGFGGLGLAVGYGCSDVRGRDSEPQQPGAAQAVDPSSVSFHMVCY